MKFLGVDSGGTKTDSIILNSNYEFLGFARGGPGNYHSIGREKAKKNIENSIEEALLDAGGMEKVDYGFFGIGGLDSTSDYDTVSNSIGGLGHCREMEVVNDVVLSYYSTTAGKPGISVLSGTGSIAYGVDEKGDRARVGGWGPLIGDEGSGYYVSVRGLRAATRAYDGRGEETELVDLATNHFDLDEFEDIVKKLDREIDDSRKIATFAEPVVEAASKGDSVASRIIGEATEELAEAVLTLKDKLEIKGEFVVGCTGGLFSSGLFYRKFKEKVVRGIPGVEVHRPIKHPVVGAAVMAAEKMGDELSFKDVISLDKGVEEMMASFDESDIGGD